jgi:transcriptional regulator with XRE-family HTH domain
MKDLGDEFEFVNLSQDVRSAMCWRMQELGMTRKDLARRLDVTPGRISQLLSGDENLTLKTIAAISGCLGARAEMTLIPAGVAPRPSADVLPGRV